MSAPQWDEPSPLRHGNTLNDWLRRMRGRPADERALLDALGVASPEAVREREERKQRRAERKRRRQRERAARRRNRRRR